MARNYARIRGADAEEGDDSHHVICVTTRHLAQRISVPLFCLGNSTPDSTIDAQVKDANPRVGRYLAGEGSLYDLRRLRTQIVLTPKQTQCCGAGPNTT